MTPEALLIAEVERSKRLGWETCIVDLTVLADVLSLLKAVKQTCDERGRVMDALGSHAGPNPDAGRVDLFDGRTVDTAGMTPACVDCALEAEHED
jgi:hypothetical protein